MFQFFGLSFHQPCRCFDEKNYIDIVNRKLAQLTNRECLMLSVSFAVGFELFKCKFKCLAIPFGIHDCILMAKLTRVRYSLK